MHEVDNMSRHVTYDPSTETFSIYMHGDLVFRSNNLTEVASKLDWIDFLEGP
jgi:hypothetical protein